MARPSGWYDDPNDDSLLRYWDGVLWTEHTAPRRPPAPAPRSSVQDEPRGGAGGPAAGEWPSRASRREAQQSGRDAPGRPAGFDPRAGFPGDRARLAPWWRRVIAFLVDFLLTVLLTMPFVFGRAEEVSAAMNTWIGRAQEAVSSGATTPPQMPPELVQAAMMITLTHLIVRLIYEIGLLCWVGTTLGRMLVGIRVRMRGGEGPLPVAAALRRSVVKFVADILGGLPIVSFVANIFQVVDYLWPLRDPNNQSLHDKVAGTEVVRGGPVRRRRDAAGPAGGDRRL